MSGLGRKVFSPGEVLTAADVNGYLQDQAVMNFAGTASRASAIPTPSEGMVTHIGGGTVQVYDGSDWTSISGSSSSVAGDNFLYNGAMQVAQRGTSTASITGTSYNTADRWLVSASSLGTWTQSIEADGPTGSGLTKSLKMLCTTADGSPAASDYVMLVQPLEGYDVQRIAKGTASAQQLTLSFWVKSNATGTYIAELYDTDNSRSVSGSYSITSSATWEQKVITFPADTTGTLNNDNDTSLLAQFWLGSGSTYSSGSPLQTTWGTATNTRAVGQTNVAAATNNYWQITGVQLELGATATPFEFKPYGVELAECWRYFYKYRDLGEEYVNGYSTAAQQKLLFANFPVPMRAAPTVTTFDVAGTSGKMTTISTAGVETNNVTPGLVLTNTKAARIYWDTTPPGAACSIQANAEL
jgi:hypothetical protein